MATLFGGPKALAAPTVTPPPEMPDPLSPEAIAARRKTMADGSTGGRRSTTLTSAAGTLAGSTLGGGA